VTFGDTGLDVDPALVATRGTVIALERPHLLAFTWGDEPLRFELTPSNGGCVLVFTHEFSNRAGAARFAAGWSVCLDRLATVLGDSAGPGPWHAYYEEHAALFTIRGTFARERGDGILRFERVLEAPASSVWAALTEPGRVAHWLADARIELREGGAVELRFDAPPGYVVTGTVTRVDAPRAFEHTWTAPGGPDGAVSWQLIPLEERCLLMFTHTFRGEWDEAGTLAAWDLRLERLAASVRGHAPGAFDHERWGQLAAEYRSRIGESA
jgi:uncharacterized protein YndB with AHSA1/START domain